MVFQFHDNYKGHFLYSLPPPPNRFPNFDFEVLVREKGKGRIFLHLSLVFLSLQWWKGQNLQPDMGAFYVSHSAREEMAELLKWPTAYNVQSFAFVSD